MATYLGKIEGGRITAVIVVTIYMENLLAVYGQKAAEDAFRETSPENDHLGSASSSATASPSLTDNVRRILRPSLSVVVRTDEVGFRPRNSLLSIGHTIHIKVEGLSLKRQSD